MQRRSACAAAGLFALASTGLAGCGALWRPSPVTMNLLFDLDACGTRAPVLLVLLPGAHMAPVELQQQGFVLAVRQRGLAVDLMLADSHLGYAYDGSLFERLHHDVLAPARAQGWQRVWLAGISLGAYAAMGCAMRHPALVDGVFAVAPYLGRQALVQEIVAARAQGQSLRQWLLGSRQRKGTGGDADTDLALWHWLVQRPADAPPLHLAYGLQDRLVAGHELMAQTLPPHRVLTAPGGHDWPPWRSLWARWLDHALLPAQCPA